MARNKKTSKRVGTTASKNLRSRKSSKAAKSVAGSALTKRPVGRSAPFKKGYNQPPKEPQSNPPITAAPPPRSKKK